MGSQLARRVLIGLLLVCLLSNAVPILPVSAADEPIVPGKAAFVSYLAAEAIPIISRPDKAYLDKALQDPQNYSLMRIELGTPVRVTFSKTTEDNVRWWHIRTAHRQGWITQTVLVDGKNVPTLVPATVDRYNFLIETLNKLIQTKPTAEAYDSRGLAYLGLTYIRTHRYEQALADFTKAIELDTNFALAYAHKSLVLIEMNRYRDALVAIDEAIRLSPKEAGFYLLRCRINYFLGLLLEAQSDASNAESLASMNVSGTFWGALVMEDCSRCAGVSLDALAENVVLGDPNSAEGWFLLARIATRKSDMTNAKRYYQLAIDAEPAGPFAYVSRAYFLMDYFQDFTQAEADIKLAYEKDPDDAEAHRVMANFYYLAQGDLHKAVEYALKAIRSEPYNVHAYENITFFYEQLQDYDNAIKYAKQMIEVTPDSLCACGYMSLGDAYYLKRDYKNAWEAYQKHLMLRQFPLAQEYEAALQQRIKEVETYIK